MVTTDRHARAVQARRKQAGKKGLAGAVKRHARRSGVNPSKFL